MSLLRHASLLHFAGDAAAVPNDPTATSATNAANNTQAGRWMAILCPVHTSSAQYCFLCHVSGRLLACIMLGCCTSLHYLAGALGALSSHPTICFDRFNHESQIRADRRQPERGRGPWRVFPGVHALRVGQSGRHCGPDGARHAAIQPETLYHACHASCVYCCAVPQQGQWVACTTAGAWGLVASTMLVFATIMRRHAG